MRDLIATGVIADAKMAYFDVRPSSHVPTVELRVCDACPLVDDAVLIAGLFRGLVATAEAAVLAGEPFLTMPRSSAPRRDVARGPQRVDRRSARRPGPPRAHPGR